MGAATTQVFAAATDWTGGGQGRPQINGVPRTGEPPVFRSTVTTGRMGQVGITKA